MTMITKKKICEITTELTEGNVTMSKKELWLIVICAIMTGIVYGLLKAPMTHGVRIGCNNGNNNDNGAFAPKAETEEKKCCKKKEEKQKKNCECKDKQ